MSTKMWERFGKTKESYPTYHLKNEYCLDGVKVSVQARDGKYHLIASGNMGTRWSKRGYSLAVAKRRALYLAKDQKVLADWGIVPAVEDNDLEVVYDADCPACLRCREHTLREHEDALNRVREASRGDY